MQKLKSTINRSFLITTMVVAMGLPMASWAADEPESEEVQEAVEKAIKMHQQAVEKLVIEKNIQIPYAYVAQLMRLPNAFGEGAACVICHSSNDPSVSYRGLDLSSCKGILKGATEAPARAIIEPGKPKKGLLRRHIRNNRMPLGVAFDFPPDTPNILAVKKWIDDGAKNNDHFNRIIMPLFRDINTFGTMIPCIACHMSNQEPPSFHELDMTTYDGIMLGADALAKAKEGKPPVKIVIPGDAEASKLYQRLVENRMPAGISPAEDRNNPNLSLMLRWVKQGAKCS